MSIPAVGAFMLGVFVSFLVWYFVVRFGKSQFTSAGLTSVVAVLVGGAVNAFIALAAEVDKQATWWYPIGLVGGWIIFTITRTYEDGGARYGGKRSGGDRTERAP